MTNLVDELVNLLDLETIELNLFRGESCDVGGRSVFGGQVISQSLVAAYRTLEEQRQCHSLHAIVHTTVLHNMIRHKVCSIQTRCRHSFITALKTFRLTVTIQSIVGKSTCRNNT